MRDLNGRGDLCCINTATLGYREPLAVTAERIAAQGFRWITPWRQEVDEDNPQPAADAIRAAGLKVNAYCRTAYFASNEAAGRRAAIESNRRALETAAVLGAPVLVAVVGGLPAGFKDRFEKALRAADFPIELSEVRMASDPLHSTAKGTLVAALCEA